MLASIDEEDRMLSEYEPKVKGEHQIAIGGDWSGLCVPRHRTLPWKDKRKKKRRGKWRISETKHDEEVDADGGGECGL
jgi:hypothetical protein